MQLNSALRILALSAILYCFVFQVSGIAQEKVEEIPEPLTLKIVDSNGSPIENVIVKLSSLVFESNSGVSISGQNAEEINGGEMATNGEGLLSIRIPFQDRGELARFHLNCKHPEFAECNEWLAVDVNGPTKVVLSRGVRIAAMAIDSETKEPITKNLYAIAEQQESDAMFDWKLMENGTLVSRPLNQSDRRIRFVQIVDGIAIRFSDVIDIDKGDGQQTLLRNVLMKPAIKLTGRLSDNVPRPVKNGMVQVCVAWPTESEQKEFGPAGHWLAHTTIDESGNFELSGIPDNNNIQVMAYSEGWIHKSADVKLRKLLFPGENSLLDIEDNLLPAIFSMEEASKEIFLEMQPAVNATIRFLDVEGKPIANADVVTEVRQRFFCSSWESRNYGAGWNTGLELQACRNQVSYAPIPSPKRVSTTDQDGVVQFENLPQKKFLVRISERNFKDNFRWKEIEIDDDGKATLIDD